MTKSTRLRGLCVLLALVLLLLATSPLEAGRGRCRKPRCLPRCCICTCHSATVPCLCLLFPIVEFGATDLYYIHQYDECDDEHHPQYCTDPIVVYDEYETGIPPQDCEEEECFQRVSVRKTSPRLPDRKPKNYNGRDLAPKNTRTTGTSRDIKFQKPNDPGVILTARVFKFRVRTRSNRAWPKVAFGCEIVDDDLSDNEMVTVRHHGSQPYMYEYTDRAGDICVIITHN